MFEVFTYTFLQRAFVSGAFLAVLFALLGVFVMLRRMSFFADGVAHGSLAGVALALLFSWSPLPVALLVALIFAVLIHFFERHFDFASDTLIGVFFTTGLALGVVLMNFIPGYQPELISYLFGNILSIGNFEFWLIAAMTVVISVFVIFVFKPLVLLSLDRDTAHVSGVRVDVLNLLFYIALALSVVLGVKVLGLVLVSALLIIPVAAAKILAKSFRSLMIWSLILAQIAVFFGVILSYYWDLPTGPAIVLFAVVLLILAALSRFFRK